jgi:hypothetical protein
VNDPEWELLAGAQLSRVQHCHEQTPHLEGNIPTAMRYCSSRYRDYHTTNFSRIETHNTINTPSLRDVHAFKPSHPRTWTPPESLVKSRSLATQFAVACHTIPPQRAAVRKACAEILHVAWFAVASRTGGFAPELPVWVDRERLACSCDRLRSHRC